MLKYSESLLSQLPYLELFQSGEGPVRAFFGGASLETFSGEAQLKKSPCTNRVPDWPPLGMNLPSLSHHTKNFFFSSKSGGPF